MSRERFLGVQNEGMVYVYRFGTECEAENVKWRTFSGSLVLWFSDSLVFWRHLNVKNKAQNVRSGTRGTERGSDVEHEV